jgi:hypothetical protein
MIDSTTSKATEAQSREVRHRRRVIRILFLAAGICWLAGNAIVEQTLGESWSCALVILGLVAMMFFALFFVPQYWRCPICKNYFERGNNGRSCSACGTEFDLKGR